MAALLLAVPLAAEAQQTGKVWRIGVLSGSPPTTPEAARPWEALFERLRELGYIEGQNLAVEQRWAEGRAERYHELAAELVALKPDLIVAAYTPSVSAVKRATSTIPIVIAIAGDPVGAGLVASLARPGGNITGMSAQNSPELAGRRLELLKEAFPSVSRVGFLVNRRLPHRAVLWTDLERTALGIGIKLQSFEVSGPEDFAGGLTAKASGTFQAVVVHPDPLAFNHRRDIAEFDIMKRGTHSFHEQVAEEGLDAAVFRPRRDLPPFKGNILDFHTHLLVDRDARTDPVSSDDAAWIATHFETFNRLASKSEAFRLALEAAIDWRYAKEPRLALGRIWSGIEAVFGITSELVYRISILAASLLEERGESRKARFQAVKSLYGLRSKAVHGEPLAQEHLLSAMSNSYRLLCELLLLTIERGHVLGADDFDDALFG